MNDTTSLLLIVGGFILALGAFIWWTRDVAVAYWIAVKPGIIPLTLFAGSFSGIVSLMLWLSASPDYGLGSPDHGIGYWVILGFTWFALIWFLGSFLWLPRDFRVNETRGRVAAKTPVSRRITHG